LGSTVLIVYIGVEGDTQPHETATDKGQITERARGTCLLSTRGLENNGTSVEFSVMGIPILVNKILTLFTILNMP
jgi:hypothetical protein